ncbi:MAG: response regulator [Elusimicrobiota bacterium]|jgi:two-component system phosphate regulon response regulator PhoB
MSTNKKVLAIDDDVSVCEFYQQCLSAFGFHVTCAPGAKQAREHLAKHRPDIILMDVMMPETDGITLTRELRDDPKTSDIPIIVVSGLADAGTLNDALLFGAVDYMVKPIDIEVLKSKIERAVTVMEHRKKTAG